ncbi:hypothetical protein [Streptomyces sp. NRRL B-24484]|uniref:hypothetical protein n=1 Tax=Streptomyces sp. NRRL B-24484 TaxID=1463833 RepID=UPI0004C0EB09|nr:hypothetical protein [Streptomyces sp. NRRL B-24484]
MNDKTEFDFVFISAVRGVGEQVEKVIPGSSSWLVLVASQSDGYHEMLEFWSVTRAELNGFDLSRAGKRKAQQVARAREVFSLLISAVRFAEAGDMSVALGFIHRAWKRGWAGVR